MVSQQALLEQTKQANRCIVSRGSDLLNAFYSCCGGIGSPFGVLYLLERKLKRLTTAHASALRLLSCGEHLNSTKQPDKFYRSDGHLGL